MQVMSFISFFVLKELLFFDFNIIRFHIHWIIALPLYVIVIIILLIFRDDGIVVNSIKIIVNILFFALELWVLL